MIEKEYTIQELATAVTDFSTTQISEVQGKSWQDSVVLFGESLKMFDQVVDINTYMVGKGDKTVTIPKTTSVLSIDTVPSAGEGDVRDNTEITNLDTVDLTIAAASFLRGSIAISKQIVLTSRVDLVAHARDRIAQAMSQDVDKAIAGSGTGDAVAAGGAGLQHADVTNNVFGGSGVTAPSGLAAGDVFTTDMIPDAMAQIENSDFVPAYLFVSPYQMKVLRKDPQFVNAAEYGANSVVMKGEIGQYLGIKIISTTNTPAYALGAQDINQYAVGDATDVYAAAANVCPMVGVSKSGMKVAGTLAWKEMPAVGYEFKPNEATHFVFYDQAFIFGLVQPKAVSLIKVLQA